MMKEGRKIKVGEWITTDEDVGIAERILFHGLDYELNEPQWSYDWIWDWIKSEQKSRGQVIDSPATTIKDNEFEQNT